MQIHLLQEFPIQDEVKVVKENQCLAAEELLLEGKYSPLKPSDQQVRHPFFSNVRFNFKLRLKYCRVARTKALY